MERNEAYNLYHKVNDFVKELKDIGLVYSGGGNGTITKKAKLRKFGSTTLHLGEILNNRILVIYTSRCVKVSRSNSPRYIEERSRFNEEISRLQKLAQAYVID